MPFLPAPSSLGRSARVVAAATSLVVVGAALALSGPTAIVSADELAGAISSIGVNVTESGVFDTLRIDLTFAIPDTAAPGDTFHVTLPPELVGLGTGFPLRDPDDPTLVVADAAISGQVVTFTLTDYVATHDGVSGSAWFEARWVRSEVAPDQDVLLAFDVDGAVFRDTVRVTGEGLTDRSLPNKFQGWRNITNEDSVSPFEALRWVIASQPTPAGVASNTVTIVDRPGPGTAVSCAAFAVSETTQVDAFHELVGLTPVPPARKTVICTPTEVTIVVTGVGPSTWVNVEGRSSVTDPSLTSYVNSGSASVGGPSVSVSAATVHAAAGGEAGGVTTTTTTIGPTTTTTVVPTTTTAVPTTTTSAPRSVASVSVGDLVWRDTDGDGTQDGDEPGIGGVTLTIVGPGGGAVTDVHGAPVGPTTTDASGHYTFGSLPVLAPGQQYTVMIDAASPALAGLSPTSPGVGPRATDSSTGRAASGDLTSDGARDATLDFGFVATPSATSTTTPDPAAVRSGTTTPRRSASTRSATSSGLAATGTRVLGQVLLAAGAAVVGAGVLTVRRRMTRR